MIRRALKPLPAVFFFFSSRRRHTRCLSDWEFRRVLFRSILVFAPPVFLRVDEVRNHLDRAIAESAAGLVGQVLRDRGQPVRLRDRKPRDRQEAFARPDQRNVGAVQRRDERQVALRFVHLARQKTGRRVRDRVMHVQRVQLLVLGDLDDLRRQRQVVRRKFEERVIEKVDLVKPQPLVQHAQPRRQSVTDEMDVVAALGQLAAQLGAYYPAAAVCGEDCNADVHCGGWWLVVGGWWLVVGGWRRSLPNQPPATNHQPPLTNTYSSVASTARRGRRRSAPRGRRRLRPEIGRAHV